MADPLSILGAATGVISLVLQVTDECIKAFKLYHEALGMPDAYRYLHLRLQVEQQRFLNFGVEAGILFTDGVLCSTLRINRSLLLAVLAEIKVLLATYTALNGRYEDIVRQEHDTQNGVHESGSELIDLLCLTQPAETQDASGKSSEKNRLKTLRRFGHNIAQTGRSLRTVVTEPRRLVWVKFDQESFEDLTTKIADLNTFLISLLDSSQITRLQDVASKTYLEILQVHSDVASLTNLVKALDPAAQDRRASSLVTASIENQFLLQAAPRDRERERATQRYLEKLVEIKIRYNQGNQSVGQDITAPDAVPPESQLKLEDFTFLQNSQEDSQLDARVDVQYQGRFAWIEWKYVTAMSDVSRRELQQIERRVQLLTNLLCYEKPEEFRAPPCLGYVKSAETDGVTRFGFVFERPPAVAPELQLYTLQGLLGKISKPSLSDRLKLCVLLARSLLNFHAVGWLHKGVRSDNIVLFAPPVSSSSSAFGPVDLNLPYVTGFDLSRPGIIDSMTEKPQLDAAKDVYRHPFAQSIQSGGNYRRSFDLYSLGIVMIEIGMWKRIEDVVGLSSDVHRARPSTLQTIQPWLLGRPYRSNSSLRSISSDEDPFLKRLASECGDTFSGVVEDCLTMDEADRAQYAGESEASVAIRVQRITQEDILGKLERMALVL